MGTGTGRGGRGRGNRDEGNSGGKGNLRFEGPYTYDEDDNLIRVKVGVAWINGDKSGPYLDDMVSDEVYLRFSLSDYENLPKDWNIYGFPNKNKKGKAPDIDFVAMPKKNKDG